MKHVNLDLKMRHLAHPALRNFFRPWKTPIQTILSKRVLARAGTRVVFGCFRNMSFAVLSPDWTKLLGTYELELHGVLGDLSSRHFDQIVNVGAGEGYYAVGLARLFPNAQMIAFEADISKHAQIRTLADQNGVTERICIKGSCCLSDFAAVLTSGSKNLVVMDVEGFESELLAPEVVPALRSAVVLVELHDGVSLGEAGPVARQLAPSHHIQAIPARPRVREDFPMKDLEFQIFPDRALIRLMSENRCFAQEWLFAMPR